MMRPGVATTISGPLRSAAACGAGRVGFEGGSEGVR